MGFLGKQFEKSINDAQGPFGKGDDDFHSMGFSQRFYFYKDFFGDFLMLKTLFHLIIPIIAIILHLT
jgi:hypothetical protein